MAEVQHGLLHEKVSATESTNRDGEKTVTVRATHELERYKSSSSVHLTAHAAMRLYVELGEILLKWMEE